MSLGFWLVSVEVCIDEYFLGFHAIVEAEIEIELDETTASWYDPDALEAIDADKDAWDYVEPEPTEIANKRPKLRVHWRV